MELLSFINYKEKSTIAKAKKGNKEAFLALINENRLNIYKVSKGILNNKCEIEDAIQNTIIKAYVNIKTLKDDKYFKTWIIRILINECNDILRKNKRVVSIQDNIVDENYYDEYVEIPDEFMLSLQILKVGDLRRKNAINGNWDFEIPISNSKLKDEVIEKDIEKDIDISLDNIQPLTAIKKIITTPINTTIQGVSRYNYGSSVEFMVFDDKGRYLETKLSEGFGVGDTDATYQHYFSNNFKEVYSDSSSLTFIPYTRIHYNMDENNIKTQNDNEPIKVETPINLQGETSLKTYNGDDYGTITRIESLDGITKVYYKSNYVLLAAPREIHNITTG